MGNNKLSKFLSLILRHKPEVIGIQLDKYGWADVEELINKMQVTGRMIDRGKLEQIVATDSKQRYSFNEDRTKIRANQGHSILVDVELTEQQPPDVLYHGTAERFLGSIVQEGLKPMGRLYVHLSTDKQTAMQVGKRHGKPVILRVDSKSMYKDGEKFFLSENGVWLIKVVDKKYLDIEGEGNYE